MDEYLAFVKNLLSAHTFYLGACVKMIVDNFRLSMHDCRTFWFVISAKCWQLVISCV